MTGEEIEAAFLRLVPAEVKVAAAAVADAPADWPLPPDLAKARVVRQREFIAGRWCATRALAQLGVWGTIGRREDRAPVWPGGVVGSISHTREVAAAAVGRVAGLGIDLEKLLNDQALEDVRKVALAPVEWERVKGDRGLVTALFSAKETLFKCVYPRTGVFLDFSDAELVRADEKQLVLATKTEEHAVRFALEGGYAFTALVQLQ
jgi:enterobactin synthetase component D